MTWISINICKFYEEKISYFEHLYFQFGCTIIISLAKQLGILICVVQSNINITVWIYTSNRFASFFRVRRRFGRSATEQQYCKNEHITLEKKSNWYNIFTMLMEKHSHANLRHIESVEEVMNLSFSTSIDTLLVA